ncbi:MAG: DUF1499 domain-containing protein [Chlorobium sp.]|uniref:DUF1499 domain-containing protein n=1 Tax=Chlorobium sp. TaxID=1095 RepID=UPI0025B7B9F7|nr:DUF1499 domain-containing protein [Chlorobium sp.]MCF8216813.1 DUF1499 domain-containing protein [Chlorobium sp.]MCF8271658.1 DUF1499 domain-containing protein [Chlorobium sp.]MCF8288030.1 DUF1499 domain-containing protein [Chlorobium sp.]MCF8291614.1 DUF1499 domain-containing protein [Chlorobium sp.]MCF8385752.1 DUF1499 domain-containing protein [Chlorobium sp.]
MDIINEFLGAVTKTVSGLWPAPEETPRLADGKLRPCPGTPNCVCSEEGSSGDRIEPLTYRDDPAAAWQRLQQIVSAMGGKIERTEDDYLWSTFMVPVFGFVDDVEFRIDRKAGCIQVRSASRLGFSDLGVNRTRIEDLRKKFNG